MRFALNRVFSFVYFLPFPSFLSFSPFQLQQKEQSFFLAFISFICVSLSLSLSLFLSSSHSHFPPLSFSHSHSLTLTLTLTLTLSFSPVSLSYFHEILARSRENRTKNRFAVVDRTEQLDLFFNKFKRFDGALCFYILFLAYVLRVHVRVCVSMFVSRAYTQIYLHPIATIVEA